MPEDTRVLVVGGPRKDYFQRELDMIDGYIKSGGAVLMLCDPCPLPNIEAYLEGHGVKLPHDFVIDSKSKLMGLDQFTPIISPNKKHPLARKMNEAAVFPYCRSVVFINDRNMWQNDLNTLAVSSPTAWAETNTQSVYDNEPIFDRTEDRQGPVSVALVVPLPEDSSSGEKSKPGRLIVMGDSDFAANHYLNILGNKDLFLNTINWLAQKADLLSARSRRGSTPVSMLFLTENEGRLVFWSSVVVEPGLVLLVGLMVLLWRRLKR